MRAATSAGANYSEACGAESKKDWVHKLQVAVKLREADYWLKLIARTEMLKPDRLKRLIGEADEIIAILVAAVTTAKRKRSM